MNLLQTTALCFLAGLSVIVLLTFIAVLCGYLDEFLDDEL